ncbi:hypothetical protein GYMLUDRAFT_204660 [Collybiopsis luxurians FD-317 M1]|uniref:WSC domain-containing protein n=1 Tax=Collybiopsis luxurians FD-317 M1 TaxID=944289 RepID=A0A0D0B0V5_9AGAR|nr:hypothetical protein GYMLUDRAFT_204660 [Collybiopsis luxurians FD-317 M1]
MLRVFGIAILLQLTLHTCSSTIETRQTSIPTGWSVFGCYTDNTSAGRLLRTNSGLPANTITPAVCIEYCSSNNWAYAGVEYGGECWCDEELHETGFQGINASFCNTGKPCSGDPTQTCGGSNIIEVFWDGDFVIPASPATLSRSFWTYSGCFVDSTSHRTLPNKVQTIGGVTPPSCADACAFHGYTIMGTEYGQECWCGNSTGTAAQVPESDCAMTCNADRDFLCGDANRLSVYHHNPGPQETYTNLCTANVGFNASDFNIIASPKEPSTSQSGWNGAILRIIDVLTDGNATWSMLSGCQNCNVTWLTLSFNGGFLIPTVSFPDGAAPMISIDLFQGESVLFQTKSTLPPDFGGYEGYCASPSPYPPESGFSPTDGPILLGNGRADAWAMCPNSSAFPVDRLDLVLQPSANHPHYNIEECIAVDLFLL